MGVPVGGYGATGMSDAVAYEITRSFWNWKDRLGDQNAWWDAVSVEMLPQLGAPLYPGARRYYEEAGIDIPESLL